MSVKTLLDFIGKCESGGDYNVVWAGIKPKNRPDSLVKMTIKEVLGWQGLAIAMGYKSTAAGKYQIIRKTLIGVCQGGGIPLESLFDEEGQDRIARKLLERRGLDFYIEGTMKAETFANHLAKEWASLPCVSGPKKGRSYYSGDGLNKALVDVQPFLDAVASVR